MLKSCYKSYKRSKITAESRKLGELLRHYRLYKRMYQRDVANLINTGQAVISQYEQGIRIPSEKVLDRYFRSGIFDFDVLNRSKFLQSKAVEAGNKCVKSRIKYLK